MALCHEATVREAIDNDEGGDVGGRHDRLHTLISEEVCRQQRVDDGLERLCGGERRSAAGNGMLRSAGVA